VQSAKKAPQQGFLLFTKSSQSLLSAFSFDGKVAMIWYKVYCFVVTFWHKHLDSIGIPLLKTKKIWCRQNRWWKMRSLKLPIQKES
jgi:hypothetical protein